MQKKFKVTGVIIGLTIVAIGTSAPELAVQSSSAMTVMLVGLDAFIHFSFVDNPIGAVEIAAVHSVFNIVTTLIPITLNESKPLFTRIVSPTFTSLARFL